MGSHNAEAIIVTCIDFRLQDFINNWISKNFGARTFDRVAFAGGVKDLENILNHVKIAHDLHHIKKVVFINHEECGAYGKSGTFEKHVHDLTLAKEKVQELYPHLSVDIYYMYLNGKLEKID